MEAAPNESSAQRGDVPPQTTDLSPATPPIFFFLLYAIYLVIGSLVLAVTSRGVGAYKSAVASRLLANENPLADKDDAVEPATNSGAAAATGTDIDDAWRVQLLFVEQLYGPPSELTKSDDQEQEAGSSFALESGSRKRNEEDADDGADREDEENEDDEENEGDNRDAEHGEVEDSEEHQEGDAGIGTDADVGPDNLPEQENSGEDDVHPQNEELRHVEDGLGANNSPHDLPDENDAGDIGNHDPSTYSPLSSSDEEEIYFEDDHDPSTYQLLPSSDEEETHTDDDHVPSSDEEESATTPYLLDYFAELLVEGVLIRVEGTTSGQGEDRECPICYKQCNVPDREPVITNPCEHFFCSNCVTRWLDERGNCPCCRRILCHWARDQEDWESSDEEEESAPEGSDGTDYTDDADGSNDPDDDGGADGADDADDAVGYDTNVGLDDPVDSNDSHDSDDDAEGSGDSDDASNASNFAVYGGSRDENDEGASAGADPDDADAGADVVG